MRFLDESEERTDVRGALAEHFARKGIDEDGRRSIETDLGRSGRVGPEGNTGR